MIIFQVFPVSAYQAELERYRGHIKLDITYPFHGADGRLIYDLHDKNWIPLFGINTPSDCKADTKNIGCQEKKFFDWNIHLEKTQIIRDLTDDTKIYQAIHLPRKKDQSFCKICVRSSSHK